MSDDPNLKPTELWEPEPEPEPRDKNGRVKPPFYVLTRQQADYCFDLGSGTCLLVKRKDETQPRFAIFSVHADDRLTMIGHRREQREPHREVSRPPLTLESIEWTTSDGRSTLDTHLQVVRAALHILNRWFDVDAALAQLRIDRT